MLGLRVAVTLLILAYGAIFVNYQYTVLTKKASHWDGFEKSKVVEYMAMLTYLVFCAVATTWFVQRFNLLPPFSQIAKFGLAGKKAQAAAQ